MNDSKNKKTFFKILQEKGGDKSILTRVSTQRSEMGPTAPVTRIPERFESIGGPISSGVVCKRCLQPASTGCCKLQWGSKCGPFINERQLSVSSSQNPSRHVSRQSRAIIASGGSLPVGCASPASTCTSSDEVFYPENDTYSDDSTYWIGCRFIYSLRSENVKIEIIQNGQLPPSFRPRQKLYANITLVREDKDVKKSVCLGTVGQAKQKRVKTRFNGHSCFNVQHNRLEVELFVKEGLFRTRKIIDTWTIPLTECHFLYPRTKWHYVE